jgi:hypothetical protein
VKKKYKRQPFVKALCKDPIAMGAGCTSGFNRIQIRITCDSLSKPTITTTTNKQRNIF